MAYSLDLRERVVKAYEESGNQSEVARRFSVSRWVVGSWVKRAKEGKLEAQSPPGQKGRLDEQGCEVLRKQVEEHKDWTLEEHSRGMKEKTGIELRKSAIGNYLNKMRISYKKKSTCE
jgi:transposase